LPNIGWLGRVHRGTPWQTVYLKASSIKLDSWTFWSGDNSYFGTNAQLLDATLTTPTNDWRLFDLFTTTIHDNATRGQLSINQTNLAAWSAVLSGVIALTNSTPPTNIIIPPAGIYWPPSANVKPPQVVQIWQGINSTRTATNQSGYVFPNGVFNHLGDILATPQLTDKSPFLNFANLTNYNSTLNDEVMERIPQQIMSLLSLNHTPRFVVYSYGQTLKPADHSIVVGSGSFNGLCTNYQVTAETATRAVVRVEGSFDQKYTVQNPDPFGNYYPLRIVVEQFSVLPPD
jgi:hypothetical protein